MIIIKSYERTSRYEEDEEGDSRLVGYFYIPGTEYLDENKIVHLAEPKLVSPRDDSDPPEHWYLGCNFSGCAQGFSFPVDDYENDGAERTCRAYFQILLEALKRVSPGICGVPD